MTSSVHFKTPTLEEVTNAGRDRLYPPLGHSSWLILTRRRELFRRWLDQLPARNLGVLDIGGRLQPYRALIQNRLVRYLSVDLQVTPLVGIVADVMSLPIADQQFDLVICTQMLEYVPDPRMAIMEIRRVLKPTGVLLLSVPSISVRDAEADRWRFWPAGIRQLLEDFAQVEIVAEGSSVIGFFRTLNVGLETMAKYPLVRSFFRRTAIPLSNLTGALLEKLAGSNDDTFAVNYSVRAQK